MIQKTPISTRRIRHTGNSFAFLPHPFLRKGFLSSLTLSETRLYLLYVLASDHQGLSFYNPKTICRLLHFCWDDYEGAHRGLLEQDLIAEDKSLVQVLELPSKPAARF